MSSQRLVFRNGFVVSIDPELGDMPHTDVLIQGSKIVRSARTSGEPERERHRRAR